MSLQEVWLCEECNWPLKRKYIRFCNTACKHDFEAANKSRAPRKRMGPAPKAKSDPAVVLNNTFLLGRRAR